MMLTLIDIYSLSLSFRPVIVEDEYNYTIRPLVSQVKVKEQDLNLFHFTKKKGGEDEGGA